MAPQIWQPHSLNSIKKTEMVKKATRMITTDGSQATLCSEMLNSTESVDFVKRIIWLLCKSALHTNIALYTKGIQRHKKDQ